MSNREKAGLRDPKCPKWGYLDSPPAGPQVRCILIANHDGECDFGSIASRSRYGSTVAGRDLPEPVAPIPAHERPSAARSGSSAGDGPRGGSNGPRAVQESLLPVCPKCGTSIKNSPGTNYYCEDEWHDS